MWGEVPVSGASVDMNWSKSDAWCPLISRPLSTRLRSFGRWVTLPDSGREFSARSVSRMGRLRPGFGRLVHNSRRSRKGHSNDKPAHSLHLIFDGKHDAEARARAGVAFLHGDRAVMAFDD